jgi:hypothetical protein
MDGAYQNGSWVPTLCAGGDPGTHTVVVSLINHLVPKADYGQRTV